MADPSQASGLKLRINVIDTVILQSGRIGAWFYTSRDGVVCRASPHECSPQAVFQKLVGMINVDESRNPYGYVALVHYDTGISRPIKQHELQDIVSDSMAADCLNTVPFCIPVIGQPQTWYTVLWKCRAGTMTACMPLPPTAPECRRLRDERCGASILHSGEPPSHSA